MNKKPRVLVISQHFFPESFRITDIVRSWVKAGAEVDVLCGFPNYPDGVWYDGYTKDSPCEEWINGAHVFRAKEHPRTNNTWKNIFLNYVSWPMHAAKRLKDLPGGYDGIFCFNTSPVLMAYPAIKASKIFNAPLTIYVLDIWPENLYTVLPIKSKVLRKIATEISNHIYKKANKLIAPSTSLSKTLDKRLGLDSESIYTIYQFAEDFYASPIHDESLHEKFSEDFLIVFTGNLSPAQGLDNVLAAYADSLPDLKKSSRILIVGSGMSKESLQKICKKLNIEKYVTFYGRVNPEDIPKFTELADAVLVSYASNKELELTIPAKMGSSLASGKPIIGVVGGDSADLLNSFHCGLVANPSNRSDITQKLTDLINASDEVLDIWGSNSHICYQKHFQSDMASQLLLDICLGNK